MIQLSCDGCGVSFSRRLTAHNANVRRGSRLTLCSPTCYRVDRSRVCEECFASFRYVEKAQRFCSRSCSSSFNNTKRKKPSIPCPSCGGETKQNRKYCPDCVSNHGRLADRSGVTLKGWREQYSISQYHAKIRQDARKAYLRGGGELKCANCGYRLHVDICHIRGVADFPDSAVITAVNATDNLIALDKRCHWEFDNDFLSLEEIFEKT
jgi:hypothetical protein